MSLTKYIYSCKPIRVIDGDTLEVDVDLGWEIHKILHIRMNGVNAPEKRTPNGPAATDYFRNMVKDFPILTLRSDVYDKYGRTVGHLWFSGEHDPQESNSLNAALEAHYVDTGISTIFHAPQKK